MALHQHELDMLQHYLPPNTAAQVIDYMHSYKIHLKIKRERSTILGDYRPAHLGKPHTISINGNLNPFHFLVTFLHELAHLINYLNHGRKVPPHGKEWKQVFNILLKNFVDCHVFPEDVGLAIKKSLSSMSASTCSDPNLFKALRKYDENDGTFMVDQLEIGAEFRTSKKQQFKVLEKRKTRFLCEELGTGKRYLFPGIYEVWKV